MKLLKIGSSPSCDIVLNSEFVSSHHADITVLDNGDIVLEDKNSTNGTFVGNKRITPNQEVPIRRGDFIRFGDTDLVWGRIPSPDKNSKFQKIVNIGSNFRNDIVANNATVSRYHATLKVTKGGKAYIVDNGSRNGTQVNGIRIQGLTRVKRGDNVLCGEEDITDALRPYLPSTFPAWGWAVSAVAVIAVILALLPWKKIIDGPTVAPEQVRPTVVYVRAAYHYNVTLEDNPFTNDTYKDLLTLSTSQIKYQATAFFIDKEGRMATNRHVAVPWDEAYRSPGDTEKFKEDYHKFLLSQLGVPSWQFFFSATIRDAVIKLTSTELGKALLHESDYDLDAIQAKIRMIESSKILIGGEIDFITVGYPGKNYTHEEEFQRCYVLSESGTEDIDLALLQLNDKKTPGEIVNGTVQGKPIHILSPIDIVDSQLVPLKDNFCFIGYPYGLYWGLDEKTHALEPNIRSTQCSKVPSKYTFEFVASAAGGSSGSPIFDKEGKLAGILSSHYSNDNAVTIAVHAKYLKKMYEEEVGSQN